MAVIITGILVHNLGKTSVALTERDGPQSFSEEFEAYLVSEGVARYVEGDYVAPAAIATVATKEAEAAVTIADPSEEESPSIDEITKPEYDTNMKAAELREIMEECQLSFKVGMSKADMVAVLDAYFDDEEEYDEDELPDISAEDPIA